jgi:hypothetical protein
MTSVKYIGLDVHNALPLLEWTIVRLVVSENDGAVTNSEMEPHGRTIASPSRTRRQSKALAWRRPLSEYETTFKQLA